MKTLFENGLLSDDTKETLSQLNFGIAGIAVAIGAALLYYHLGFNAMGSWSWVVWSAIPMSGFLGLSALESAYAARSESGPNKPVSLFGSICHALGGAGLAWFIIALGWAVADTIT